MTNRTGCSTESPQTASDSFSFFEALEARLLLANVAPTFGTALWDSYFMPEAKDAGGSYVLNGGLRTYTARTIGIDGADVNGDALTITAVSDNLSITTYIPTGNHYARLHFVAADGTTVIGDVVVQLFDADGRATLATDRFTTLATKHINADGTIVDPTSSLTAYYTNVLVHRVIPGFMIQTGDAQYGDGTGGSPLPNFNDPNPWPNLSFAGVGVLAMANSGANTNDSQFFITDAPTPWLNNKHTIFGQVISGMDVVDQIINVQRDNNDRPYNPPKLQNVQIFSSTQDATVTVYAADGFTGTAHVTVKLDDGHGGVTEKVITLRPEADLGGRPTIDTDTVTSMTAGVPKVIAPTYVDDNSMPLAYTARTSNSLVTASIDPGTGQLTLNAPASFSGVVQYQITAVEAGWADLTPTSFVASVFVHSVSEVPFHASTLAAYKGTSNYAMSGFGAGNTLYVANSGQGLARYDLTDPANPVKQASYTSNFSGARDVQVVGSTAFVADTWNGFKAFTVSDPTKFTPLGSAVATGGAAVSFAISGTTAWVADYTNGITAVDIANPAAMTKIGSFKDWPGKASVQYVMGIAIRGNTLYATDNAGWVIALDITDRTAPAYLGAFRAGPSPWGIQTYGNTGLLVSDGYTLRLWNVANPAKPTILSQVAIPGAWQVSLRGSLAVVAGDNSFTFVDLTNPGKPRVEYTYASPVQGGQAVFAGPNVILPMGGSGFSILAAARTLTTSGTIVLPVGAIATTVSLGGGGTAHIFTTDAASGSIGGIDVVGGTSKTTLTIKTAGNAAITGGDITVAGSLKSLTAATLDLRGNLSVTGSLQSLSIRSVAGGRTFTLAATDPSTNPAATATLNLGMVADLAIDSEIPLAAVTATTWISQLPAPDTIDAPSLGTLTVKGAFAPNLILDGRNSPALTLGKATISGSLASPTWSVTGAVGAISAKAWVAHWTLDHVTTIASLFLSDADFAAIDASGAIGPVKAVRWADGSLHADSVASLAVTGVGGSLAGGLGIDLSLDGASDPTKFTLGNVSVAGILTGAWAVTGKLGTLSVHDLQTNLDMPTAALAGLVVGDPLVKVTPAVGLPYLLAVGYRGELFEITFASLAKWPVTTLALSLAPGDPAPTSNEILADLALKGIKNQFVAAKLGAWAPGVVLKPALLPSFTKSTDPLSTAGTNANVAYIYDNALAIGALLEGTPDAESVARAFQIADAFVLLQNHDPMNAAAAADTDFPTLTPAPLRDGYGFGVVAATRTATAVTVRDVGISNASSGNQAYVAMALLQAADQADSAADAARAADYRATAKELLLYIGRHRAFGGAMIGFSASGDPVNGANRVTEHNLALAGAFAVLADDELDAGLKTLWQTWQASAETFRTAMYGVNPNFAALANITDTLSYFAAGANPAGTLDNSLLSLGLGALSSLGLGDNRAVGFDLIEFLATSSDTNGQLYTGFDPGFTAASGLPDGVGTEATAYMALLAQKLGDTALLAALPDRASLTPAEQSAFDFITDRADSGSTDHDLADIFIRQLANIQLYAPNTNKLSLVASPVTGTNTGQYTLVNGLSLAATCWTRFAYSGWNILTDSAV